MSKLLFLATLFFSGCAAFSNTATTQQVQTQYVQACSAYGAAFATALQLREANQLTPSEIASVTSIDSQITPICSGALPTDPRAATIQITGAITTLTILETAKGVQK